MGFIFIAIVIIILAMIMLSGLRVVQQYERGVLFVLGRSQGAKGPGLFWIPPFISRMVKVDLRIVTMQVPPQEVITRDNITIRVTAVVYFHVVNPEFQSSTSSILLVQRCKSDKQPYVMSWDSQKWMSFWHIVIRLTRTFKPLLMSILNAGALR